MHKRFSQHRFDNGLTVVLEQMPQAISTAVGIYIKAGARNEEPAQDGISHLLEHMVFKGTQTLNCRELNRAFDELGAHYNACTGWEETCFFAWVLKNDLPRVLELLAGMLSPVLPEAEFANEKKVILEEIARNRDQADHQVFEEAMRIAFAGHRLSSNVLGTEETIGPLTREQVQAYLQARYIPVNTVLFACGNIDEEVLLKEVEKFWGGRGRGKSEAPAPPPVFHPGQALLEKKGLEREHLVLLWPGPALESRANIAASLLGAVLGDDRNSRLYWALRHTGLAEEAAAGYWGFSDAGVFAAQAACDPAKAKKVLEILKREAAGLKDGIREEELQRAKNRIRTSLVFSAETPFDRFRQLMQQWAVRRELLTTAELVDWVEQITVGELNALLQQFPLDSDGVKVLLGPPKTGLNAESGKLKAEKTATPAKKKATPAAPAPKDKAKKQGARAVLPPLPRGGRGGISPTKKKAAPAPVKKPNKPGKSKPVPAKGGKAGKGSKGDKGGKKNKRL
jgi:predicted Zn-dependent peptidase